jgi:hypothetical protein
MPGIRSAFAQIHANHFCPHYIRKRYDGNPVGPTPWTAEPSVLNRTDTIRLLKPTILSRVAMVSVFRPLRRQGGDYGWHQAHPRSEAD